MNQIKLLILMFFSLILLTSCKAEETESYETTTNAADSYEVNSITTDNKTGKLTLASTETDSIEAVKEETTSDSLVTAEPEAVESDSDITLAAPVSAAVQTIETEESTVAYKSDMLDITLYLYGPDDYENPEEERVIYVSKELYFNNMADALNYVFDETKIRINSAEVDIKTKCITVDLPQEVAGKFNAGSCEGAILTNELTDTLLNLPDIESAIITVDGVKDTYADHYSFEGVFKKNKD